MATTSALRKVRIALLLVCALAIAGAIALAPSKAYVGDLVAGKQSVELSTTAYKVAKNVSAPTIDICISPGAGQLVVHATKVGGASGYEFQVARNASFTKGVKKAKVQAYGVVFKKLAKGKKYYVRARAYQTSTQLYTKWSPKKSAKTGAAYNKSKLAGTWRLISAGDSARDKAIKSIWKSQRKCIKLQIYKDGTMITRAADGTTSGVKYHWVAMGKKKGYEITSSYSKASSLNVIGKKLVMRSNSTKFVYVKM